ncbi:MAG: ABC transporter permease [Eubacterium sp.]
MTVFKTFLKILNKCKFPIIMYTVILVAFAGFQLQTSEDSMNFVASKPDVLVINQGNDTEITENFIKYIKDNCTIKDIKEDKEAISDALFYRDVNYIIYLPDNYSQDFLDGKNPQIKVKSTGDYQASYAEMLVSKYIKTANICQAQFIGEQEVIKSINECLKTNTEIKITSKLDTAIMSKAALYYNFANYSILAGCVYVICLVISSFREEKISRRIMISSMNYKRHNMLLMVSNSTFAIVLWIFYVLLSFVLLGDVMFTKRGLMYMLNSFVFTICALAIALVIGNVVRNKEAINGIVNVVALGSSFLCGSFVPMEWLPDGVLKAAHILPSYWYIKSNEILKTMEEVTIEALKPVFINMGVICGFILLFIVVFHICTKKKAD